MAILVYWRVSNRNLIPVEWSLEEPPALLELVYMYHNMNPMEWVCDSYS